MEFLALLYLGILSCARLPQVLQSKRLLKFPNVEKLSKRPPYCSQRCTYCTLDHKIQCQYYAPTPHIVSVAPLDHHNPVSYLPDTLISNFLNGTYRIAVNANATSNPISPVLRPIGPTNHSCSMHGMTSPNEPMIAQTAATPHGNSAGLFHDEISYREASPFRKTKCSTMTTATNALAQYPMRLKKLLSAS